MRGDGLCGCLTADAEYPPRVAFSLLSSILEDFDSQVAEWKSETRTEAISWPPLDKAIAKYQDPANADQIMRIQKNLDETREVLHNTIDSVLQRGEKLEDLVERSSELSSQSKLFYKQARFPPLRSGLHMIISFLVGRRGKLTVVVQLCEHR